MKKAMHLSAITVMLCGGCCILPAFCAPPVFPAHHEVMIVNMGSVYAIGYRIFVTQTGSVRYVPVADCDPTSPYPENVFTSRISTAQAHKLFQDVATAKALAKLPVSRPLDQPWTKDYMNRMAHQVGWRVQQGTDRSPNLLAPQSPQGQALYADAVDIAKTLHLKNALRK